jgi:hypothetical protein
MIAALNQTAVRKALREEGYSFTPIQDETNDSNDYRAYSC